MYILLFICWNNWKLTKTDHMLFYVQLINPCLLPIANTLKFLGFMTMLGMQ